jgi:DNA-binding response OmpR family regulator
MRELMARVKALLRRVRLIREDVATEKQEEEQPKLIAFDNLVIDLTRREVKLDGEVLALKPREYELLLFMGQQKGRLLTRPQILEQVWGWDYMGDSRTVDVHVRWLREKIEPDPETPQRIITVRGAGYRFEG